MAFLPAVSVDVVITDPLYEAEADTAQWMVLAPAADLAKRDDGHWAGERGIAAAR